MNILIGLLIIAVGSFGQSSSYVPIKKVKSWSWESFWLVQGIFAWLVFPLLGAFLAVPAGHSLGELYSEGIPFMSVLYGVLWGVGGLTFGLSSLGTCAAFGTLLPALFAGTNLFRGEGLVLLAGVCITLAGIAVIGYAGSLKARNMSDEEKQKAIRDFAFTKGISVALLGGFCTNAAYCLWQNIKNRTGREYFSVSVSTGVNNLLFCALAGLLWYSQFFGLGMGKSFFTGSPVMLAFSWSILMSLNVIFSNVWGILLKEWNGVGRRTVTVLIAGLLILIFSTVFPNLVNSNL